MSGPTTAPRGPRACPTATTAARPGTRRPAYQSRVNPTASASCVRLRTTASAASTLAAPMRCAITSIHRRRRGSATSSAQARSTSRLAPKVLPVTPTRGASSAYASPLALRCSKAAPMSTSASPPWMEVSSCAFQTALESSARTVIPARGGIAVMPVSCALPRRTSRGAAHQVVARRSATHLPTTPALGMVKSASLGGRRGRRPRATRTSASAGCRSERRLASHAGGWRRTSPPPAPGCGMSAPLKLLELGPSERLLDHRGLSRIGER